MWEMSPVVTQALTGIPVLIHGDEVSQQKQWEKEEWKRIKKRELESDGEAQIWKGSCLPLAATAGTRGGTKAVEEERRQEEGKNQIWYGSC